MSSLLEPRADSPSLEAYFLGQLPFEDALRLQQRLAFEAGERDDARVSLLLCEHPTLITVGRLGSRAHIRLGEQQLRQRGVQIRFVARGGGCIPHAAGQLAVYPILSLKPRGWTVGRFVRRFQQAVRQALAELGVPAAVREGHLGLWGRSGQLAAFGIAVKHSTTTHGAFINVAPERGVFRFVDTTPPELAGSHSTMSSLLAETGRPVRMPLVRSALIEHLCDAFECGRHHIYSSHPLLRQIQRATRDATSVQPAHRIA